MSFKCSVFGHRYGDPDVERQREEQGSEVVITIKETETCKRCGDTRVVSENKEVTTLETPSDIVGDELVDEEETEASEPADEPEPEPAADQPVETPDPPAGGDDAELIDEAESAGDAGPAGDVGVDPVDDTAGTPTADVTVPEEATETPEPEEEDAVILDDEDEDTPVEDREPGEWPDEAEEADTDEEEAEEWAPSTEAELRPVEDEQPDLEPTSSAVTVPEGTFYCPECEFTTDVESSSLRAGDFCPECHRGSLEHRADEE